MSRERLTLVPTEHWEGDHLVGKSVYVMVEDIGTAGVVTLRPDIPLKKAAFLVAKYLNEAGYSTTTLLYGKEFEGSDFRRP